MENRYPTGLSSREACAYALGMLTEGAAAPAVSRALSSLDAGVQAHAVGTTGESVFNVVVVISAGAGAEEYTAMGETAEGALEIALTLAAFPPPLDEAVESLLGALEDNDQRTLQHARACARAALIRARSAT